jgi:hypothetical protein
VVWGSSASILVKELLINRHNNGPAMSWLLNKEEKTANQQDQHQHQQLVVSR